MLSLNGKCLHLTVRPSLNGKCLYLAVRPSLNRKCLYLAVRPSLNRKYLKIPDEKNYESRGTRRKRKYKYF
jgi:hypothetical protein